MYVCSEQSFSFLDRTHRYTFMHRSPAQARSSTYKIQLTPYHKPYSDQTDDCECHAKCFTLRICVFIERETGNLITSLQIIFICNVVLPYMYIYTSDSLIVITITNHEDILNIRMSTWYQKCTHYDICSGFKLHSQRQHVHYTSASIDDA